MWNEEGCRMQVDVVLFSYFSFSSNLIYILLNVLISIYNWSNNPFQPHIDDFIRTVDGASEGGINGSTFFPSLFPWLHNTIDLNSQFPAKRCKSSLSSRLRVSPNWPNKWRRNEEWVTTAIHFSGRELSHSKNLTARSQQCSSDSRSSE